MGRRITALMLLSVCLMVMVCCSCGEEEAGGRARRGYYNRYNIHYYTREGVNFASYANYIDCPDHGVLPYNCDFKVGSYRRGFKLVARDTGFVLLFEFKSSNMGGMSVKEYLNMIMSPEPVSYDNLTPEDVEGIKAGKAINGMTKQGVMIALGYPAMHRTPSTDLNAWIYWKGRYNTRTVNFDESGKVVSVSK